MTLEMILLQHIILTMVGLWLIMWEDKKEKGVNYAIHDKGTEKPNQDIDSQTNESR